MKTSESINEMAKALASMQGQMGIAVKDRKGYNYKYADFSSIWEVLRGPMVSNGLSVVQDPVSSTEGVSVITRVMHESGQWIEFGPLLIPMVKRDAHSTGSAITYAKRYAIAAALGVVTEDDDGAIAQKNAPKEVKYSPKNTVISDKENKEKPIGISEEQYQKFEECIGNNLVLRQNILTFMKNEWDIKTIQEMPLEFYDYALKRAVRGSEQEEPIDEQAMEG